MYRKNAGHVCKNVNQAFTKMLRKYLKYVDQEFQNDKCVQKKKLTTYWKKCLTRF